MHKSTIKMSFDPAKNARNIAERGLPFGSVADLDWETAIVGEDVRWDYGERRIRIEARLHGRLHVAIVTIRGDILHVISFRKANRKEIKDYDREWE